MIAFIVGVFVGTAIGVFVCGMLHDAKCVDCMEAHLILLDMDQARFPSPRGDGDAGRQ